MLSFFLIATLAIAVIGYFSYKSGKESLEQESFNRLTAAREMKAAQIEDYFSHINDQIETFSEDHTILEAMKAFNNGFNNLENDHNISQSEISKIDNSLESYYNNEFLKRLNKNLLDKVTINEELTTDLKSRVLQYNYISNNRNEIGKKHYLHSVGDSSAYDLAHKKYHPYIRKFLEKFGYYDIFLVDAKTGYIVYSVFKEVDFATSLIHGPFKNTNIAEVFHKAKNIDKSHKEELVDFEPYHPSYNAPASFVASPIYEKGEKIGILVFQMPIDRINDIMTSKENWKSVGLGESGETYIVGEDYTLRNQSRFLIEDSLNYFKMIKDIGIDERTVTQIRNFHSTIGLQEVKTIGTEAALNGVTGSEIFPDYRNVSVLSAYKPLNIEGLNWVIMSEIDEEEAFSHVNKLRNMIIFTFLALIVIIMLISYIMSRRITKPLKHLTGGAKQLAKGNLDAVIEVKGKDEVGILALSFKKMQISIKKLIADLKDINQNLEHKVEERTYEIQLQKDSLEEKNREIVDSINYAKRLQDAILPTMVKVRQSLPDSFILFKPKDIVSGDFYWMANIKGQTLMAAVDCTGHGVPGAMVSVVGSNGLYRCVKEFGLKDPASIMEKLSEIVVKTFESEDHDVKDGMDMSLCAIDIENRKVTFAGAHNPLWIVKKNEEEVIEIKGNKQPIGKYDYATPFLNHEIQLEAGDTIYMFTDGYPDQFGGPRGKKFKYKTLKTLLLELKGANMETQRKTLDEKFEEWRGNMEQVDDVCIIGVRM